VEKRTINIPHHQKSHKTHYPRYQLENSYNHHQPTKLSTRNNMPHLTNSGLFNKNWTLEIPR
jgi:hypothetical protein